ncbi:integrase family protein [Xylella fastidiosa]|uniref:tyrosine-type recombinase/integrase n=1 Tax=Xylella fastidiosa TaxID=2371 RepID=UPI0004DCBC24|nr:tyrosine-type recombinase/integrase [Xylella fastidiosa]KFA40018.1 integrase family protein [Xylella fastidiosa]
MGRKPTKAGAIPRFRVRPQKSGVVHYYYDHGGKPRKETPLGRDYGLAIKRWAELEHAQITPAIAVTFRHVAERYRAEVIPTKAYNTQRVEHRCLAPLLKFFDDPPAPFESIKPVNIRQYLDWRTSKVIANREVSVFSHLWNWARSKGITDLPNPCGGIRRNKATGRNVYIEDTTYRAVYQAADQTLRDAMDLAYLTGQRVSDVVSMDERHIVNGALEICQAKTGAKLAITVTGELAVLIKRIFDRKRGMKLRSTRLIVDAKGLELSRTGLRYRFDRARTAAGIAKEVFQFRDLRAKAATDKADLAGDIRQAQAQLGHASVTMTEHYVRKRRGAKVTPTR